MFPSRLEFDPEGWNGNMWFPHKRLGNHFANGGKDIPSVSMVEVSRFEVVLAQEKWR